MDTAIANFHGNSAPDQSGLSARGQNLLFLIGAPRSGTTWIGKLFDSHPGVCYRHEPDTIVRSSEIPVLCDLADLDIYTRRAESYIRLLAGTRALKSAASLPCFAKRYRTPAENLASYFLAHGLRLIGRATAGALVSGHSAIPELRRSGCGPDLFVIKSVSARGRIGVFARALPDSRIVFVLRHPCGQVHSTLRGIRTGRFERRIPFEEILEVREAREAGVSEAAFASSDLVERCAWHWAVLNQKAANDLAALGNVQTVRYEDICADPEKMTRVLFEFAGLDWCAQTSRFLRRSTTSSDSGSYYRLTRNSMAAAGKWRGELAEADAEKVLSIARRFPVGAWFENL